MEGLDRRGFLRAAGGAAAFAALSESIARAEEIPAARRTGTIKDVKHIVVLMQENRSFDHYFGMLRGVRGFGDPRPVVLPSGEPVWHQSDGTRVVLPFHPDGGDLGRRFLQGLTHDWNSGHDAFAQGRYDRWIPAKTATTMAHYERGDIPFHYALADAFTVCDAYHCSFIGSTDPNRYYMMTGYTGNDGAGGGPVLVNDQAPHGWTTYAERLEKAGVSWKAYQDIGEGLNAAGRWGWTDDPYIGNYSDNSLLHFTRFREARPGSRLYRRARTGTNAKAGQGYFEILRKDVKAGRLPRISWIFAPEAFTEHPNWPPDQGAWYISGVLDALTSNPEVWSRTVLFVTYDENDGYFDHVVPPYASRKGASTADVTDEIFPGSHTHVKGPYGLGPRVPMIVVSPWSKGGWVNSQTFDHTSILRFMERRFGVREPHISPWRRAVCGDLTSAFNFSRHDVRAARLPDTSAYRPRDRRRHPSYHPTVPADQRMPSQEPGSRPARPLPYDLHVDGAVRGRLLKVVFASRGKAGACFYVTSSTDGTGPWTYTVGPGKKLTGEWDASDRYSLSVYGPNGFLREFTGSPATEGLEVRLRSRRRGGSARLVLTNRTKRAHTLTVSDAYTGEKTKIRLRPGGTRNRDFPVRSAHSWYDLSVTSSADPSFLRRMAGHLETGRPSRSDPGLRTV